MARTFDGVDDQVAFGSEAAIDDLLAYTAMAIVRLTANVTTEQMILSKFQSDFTAGKIYLFMSGAQNALTTLVKTNGVNAYADSAINTIALNTWTVVLATWASPAAPKLFTAPLGGTVAEVAYATQTAPTGSIMSDAVSSLRVASRDALDTFFAHGLAECALWNRVLSTGELAALGRGFAPAFLPNGRVFYSRIDGRTSPEMNWAGTTHGTVTGSTFLDHPPILYPSALMAGRRITIEAATTPTFPIAGRRMVGWMEQRPV